ncbi:hypothetical protein X777_11013 [Ooceraea biroi]|uniref:Uncharacterized protein n=1 Tax=Ooceraea biroi TaxID=2015173 RepID=A0A026W3M7_OOCBI|nr:hypothetical protein X777_11013 [Ooceraea biroi]
MKHIILYPTCKLVNNVPCGNIPIRQNYPFSSSSADQNVGHDVRGSVDNKKVDILKD